MNEVLGDVLADHLGFLEERGIPLERWLGPDPPPARSPAKLRNRKLRVDWVDFAELCDSYWALLEPLGLNAAFADYLIAKPDGWSARLRHIINIAVTPRVLYLVAMRVVGISAFHAVRLSKSSLGRGRLQVVLDILPEFAHCQSFFAYTAMALERLPRFLGLPEALVETVITTRRAEYLVTLPPTKLRLWSWLRGLFKYIAGAGAVFREMAARESELKEGYVALLRSQAALSKAHTELEARVAERTSAFLAAKEEAEAASRAKTAFLASVSHEIRTPLTSILGFTELLLARGAEPELRRHGLDVIDRNGRQLLSLVNDLLDIGRIESGGLELMVEPLDVRIEIDGILTSLGRHAMNRGLAIGAVFEQSLPLTVMTDPVRFRQVLTNVIGNAVKFTEAGHVKVRAGMRGTAVTLEIEDTGRGIPAELHERVFQPFEQGEITVMREQANGVGLGLTIARRLARALGGEILLARSAPGGGSLFVVTIADQRSRN